MRDIHVILHLLPTEWTYINPAGQTVPSRRHRHRDLCDHLKGRGVRAKYFREGEGWIPNRPEDQIGTVCSLPAPCPDGGEMQRVAVTHEEFEALCQPDSHVGVLWASTDTVTETADGEMVETPVPEPQWQVQATDPETGSPLTYTVEDEEGNVTELPVMRRVTCNAIR